MGDLSATGEETFSQGDGDISRLLATLNALNYTGYLTLEPHLSFAGPAGGYSGEAGMRTAIHALKALLARVPGHK
jgi:3-dehydroshikimate dehydratase